MSATQAPSPKIQVLTPEDLEAALRMLADEEQAAPGKSVGSIANLVTSLFENLVTAALFSSLSTGMVVVWFQGWTGLKLFALAVIAFVLIAVKTVVVGRIKDFDFKNSPLAEVTQRAWSNKFQTEGCVIIPGCGLWLGGLTLLLVGLIVGWNVFPVLLVPIALGSLIIALASAINHHRRFKYFSRVGRLKERLQLLSDAEPENAPSGVEVSEKERALLSEVEIKQVNKAAFKGFEEYQKQTEFYSVAIAPEPLEFMAGLSQSVSHDLRDVVADLQTEPRPAKSQPVGADQPVGAKEVGAAQLMKLETEGHRLIYAVDDSHQRVEVMSIDPIHQEVPHAF